MKHSKLSSHINRAAQQRASLQGFADDLVQVSWSLLELVHLWNPSSEILKTLSSGSSRESFIRAI